MEAEVKAFKLRELWRRYRHGETRARESDQAGLISYGMLGLIEPMERFDPKRRIRFETFAMQRIRGAIIDELRSLDIEEANPKLEHELGRVPTDLELAERLGVSEDESAPDPQAALDTTEVRDRLQDAVRTCPAATRRRPIPSPLGGAAQIV